MTDRMLIPALVPGDRLRLLDGWCGPVARPTGQRCAFWWSGLDPLIARIGPDGDYRIERAVVQSLGLDARRPEVRAHVADALAAGVQCPECGGRGIVAVGGGGPFPCYVCGGKDTATGWDAGSGWLTPPYDCRWMLHYPDLTPDISVDDSAGLIACSVARVRAGLKPVCGVFTRWVDDDEANDDAATLGYALRNPDGTLTLPWPDEVSP